MEKAHILKCNSIDELIKVARMPLSAYPTTQFALWNIEFPLNQEDYSRLAGEEINLFGVNENLQQTPGSNVIAYSSNMTGPTFTVDNPFIVVGICVMLQGEPVSTQVEGNQYGPKDYMESLSENPASPLNLRNQVALLQALMGTDEDLPENFFACPAVVDWGGSTWRFVWAMLNAWRIVFECPHSGFENIIDERLADIGSCCAHTSFQGYGDSDHPLMYITRRVNARLSAITLPAQLMATADGYAPVAESGYFYPLNSEQNSDGEITPYHYLKDRAAYGCPFQLSQYETWIRLPIPMPLNTNTKIKLTLNRRKGDTTYWQRTLDEAIMRRCVGPVPGFDHCNFPINETDQTPDPNGGIACQTIIPAGQVRVGLGLAGFQVREGTCALWRRVLDDKDLLMQLLQGDYQVMAGTCGTPIQSELIKRYEEDDELMKKVAVPAGFVGSPDR
jgi:hypothetical protein